MGVAVDRSSRCRREQTPLRISRLRLVCIAATLAGGLATPLAAFGAPVFTKGPYLQELGPTGVSVRFELASEASASVDVFAEGDGDREPKAARVEALSSAALFHSLHVGGLAPSHRYRYVARAGGASESGAFTTAPDEAAAPPFTFLLYGDNRSDDVAHAAVVRAMMTAPGDFLLNTGDFVADGSAPDDWQTFFTIEKALLRDRALFGCVGNHELIDKVGGAYLRFFGPASLAPTPEAPAPPRAPLSLSPVPATTPRGPGRGAPPPNVIGGLGGASAPTPRTRLYGTFRWSNTRFFMLNAFDTWLTGEEREWLTAELARAKTEPGLVWRIAVLHHGPYSAGPHGNNTRMITAGVPDLLARAGIDLVVSGHDHIYERGYASGLRYVVSGGGGAPLYRIAAPLESTRKAEAAFHTIEAQVTGDAVRLLARRVDGSLIDDCGFSKADGWACDGPGEGQRAAVAVTTSDAASPTLVPFGQTKAQARSKCACDSPGRPAGPGEGAPFALVLATLAAAAAFTRARSRRPVVGS